MLNTSLRLAVGLAGCWLSVSATAPISLPVHHDPEGGFVNPYVEPASGGLFDFMERRLFGEDEWAFYDPALDGSVPVGTPRLVRDGEPSGNARVTWVGQATVLIQHAGINVLTDPILSEMASPVSFAGPRREFPPGLDFDELPPIHVVVLSHDHYDHLDAATIRRLGSGPRYFVPLGLKAWLVEEGIPADRIVEMDWWESEKTVIAGSQLEMTATPSQHVSGRSLIDRNERLWASWAIRWSDFSVWFGGDTGYNDVQFREIGAYFGGFNLGIIPIGSYAPRDYMRAVHLDPADAVKVHRDIKAERSMAMHWGTFHLTAEPLLEPPKLLRDAVEIANLPAGSFSVFAIGESRAYQPH